MPVQNVMADIPSLIQKQVQVTQSERLIKRIKKSEKTTPKFTLKARTAQKTLPNLRTSQKKNK
jgi:hypothetical protein